MPDPRSCMHKMVFAEKFCVCERCGQTWRLIEDRKEDAWGEEQVWRRWDPIDPDYRYRPRPNWRRGKKRRR